VNVPDRLAAALVDRYRIERELGQGGMAMVYLAQDLRHDRRVAVKVLRPELAAVIGAERFLAEIKTTAHLQHPHILPLFDSGEAGGQLFYVMPFIEGESLRDRLSRDKQLPIADAVRIATEVASALDYAHRHKIIHRDIKPENVLLHDGQALVADFGIALAASKAGSTRMTETGMSLGTPHYMSPEQAMGEREITARSDVYALGAMTYEMLVGEPPFTGPTAQAIVAKVLSTEPVRPTGARKSIPPHVEDAVLTALEKLPADRWGSAAEFASALAGGMGARRPASSRPARQAMRRSTALVFALASLLLAAAAFLVGRTTGAARPTYPPSRLAIFAPTLGGSGASSLTRQVALSPDGQTVIYVGLDERGRNALYTQRLDAAEPTKITGSDNVWSPMVSNDGRSVVTSNLTQTFRLPLEGGTLRPVPLPAAGSVQTGAWSRDGTFWFSGPNLSGIYGLNDRDSLSSTIGEGTAGLRMQQVLDDGRTALVVRAPPGSAFGPGLFLDLQTGETTPLVDGPVVDMRVLAGELLTVLPDGSLMATPFDAGKHRITGSPVQIATRVSITGTGLAQLAVGGDGTVAYIPDSPRSLIFMSRTGAAREVMEERPNLHAPKFSPDGRRLSLDVTTPGGRDVWILDLGTHALTRATFVGDGHDAIWTPDGRYITYISFRSGVLGIYRTRPGSAAPAESLIASAKLSYTGTWLRDESALVTVGTDLNPRSNVDLAIVRNGGKGPIEPLLATPFEEQYVALSPDQRWLAFVSNQSGQPEVYVRPLDGEGDQVLVSLNGGTEPVWSPDGRELFYKTITEGQPQMMVATVRTSPVLEVPSRETLFPVADVVGTAPHANYDISPDGRNFAMVRRSAATRIMVIQNLPGLLKRLRRSEGATR
jgi:serine/threonine-protein kinase